MILCTMCPALRAVRIRAGVVHGRVLLRPQPDLHRPHQRAIITAPISVTIITASVTPAAARAAFGLGVEC